MKIIVLGAGGTGRELLRRLADVWNVVLVDQDADRLAGALSIRDCRGVQGDGSSSVVLERAGLSEAAALVAATSDDDVNLEAIRLALEAHLFRIVGVAADPERIEEYRSLGVPVHAPHGLAARNIELSIEPRRVASSVFAGGRAEAIEIELSPDASVVGRRLADLSSSTWIVAAVLRNNEIVIPHGNTVLQPRDRITVVGAASDYSGIVSTFTTGLNSFPLQFGHKVAVGVESQSDITGAVAEAASLVRNSQADTLTLVYSLAANEEEGKGQELVESAAESVTGVEVELRPVEGRIREGLQEVAKEESIGVIVVSAPDPSERFPKFKVAQLLNAYIGRVPVLLARSTLPYTEVVVPARRTPSGERAARVSIDLAHAHDIPLYGIAAVAPNFVATRVDTVEAARSSIAWLLEEGAIRGVAVDRHVKQGNPVRIITGAVTSSTLLVIGSPQSPMRLLRPGIAGLVASRSSSSVMLVPSLT